MSDLLDPRFDLWEDGTLVHRGASFNHATGFIYRAQTYGRPPAASVFDVQRSLWNGGHATINNRQALYTGPDYRSPWAACEAARILRVAGHFE